MALSWLASELLVPNCTLTRISELVLLETSRGLRQINLANLILPAYKLLGLPLPTPLLPSLYPLPGPNILLG
jgi:hypothetical protein